MRCSEGYFSSGRSEKSELGFEPEMNTEFKKDQSENSRGKAPSHLFWPGTCKRWAEGRVMGLGQPEDGPCATLIAESGCHMAQLTPPALILVPTTTSTSLAQSLLFIRTTTSKQSDIIFNPPKLRRCHSFRSPQATSTFPAQSLLIDRTTTSKQAALKPSSAYENCGGATVFGPQEIEPYLQATKTAAVLQFWFSQSYSNPLS